MRFKRSLSIILTLMMVLSLNVTSIVTAAPAAPTISVTPSSGATSNVSVAINYSSNSTIKQFKLGASGTYQNYLGPFMLTSNTTVYAKAADSAGTWSSEVSQVVSNISTTPAFTPSIDLAHLDMTKLLEPLILPSTETSGVTSVGVMIVYPTSSTVKQYKVGQLGVYQDYTAPFTVKENTTIYAKGKDSLGKWTAETRYDVKNIADNTPPTAPTISVTPSSGATSSVSVTINYSADSTQKKYRIDKPGVTGAIQNYNGTFNLTENATIYAWGADTAGNTSTQASTSVSNITNLSAPAAPIITSAPTFGVKNSATVTITYSPDAMVKQYKIGASGTYQSYTGTFNITSDTMIYAKAQNAAGNWSSEVNYFVYATGATTNDTTPPNIDLSIPYTHVDTSQADFKAGNLSNATTTADGEVKVFGVNKALSFDGVNDNVALTATSSLAKITSALTMETWVNVQAYPADDTFLRGFISKEDGYVLGMNMQGHLMAAVQTVSGPMQRIDSNYTIPLNTWTHVAATYDGTSIRFYANGTLVVTTPNNTTGEILVDVSPLTLAVRDGSPGSFTKVQMGDTRIWSVVRTDSEIQNNMYTMLEGSEKGLVVYWSMNDAKGTTLYDKTANKNNGTISGATIVNRTGPTSGTYTSPALDITGVGNGAASSQISWNKDAVQSSPVFSRNSTAYKQDGSWVSNNQPRYENGKFGQALVIEEGTTNLAVNGRLDDVNNDGTPDSWSISKPTGGQVARDTVKTWGGRPTWKLTFPIVATPAPTDFYGLKGPMISFDRTKDTLVSVLVASQGALTTYHRKPLWVHAYDSTGTVKTDDLGFPDDPGGTHNFQWLTLRIPANSTGPSAAKLLFVDPAWRAGGSFWIAAVQVEQRNPITISNNDSGNSSSWLLYTYTVGGASATKTVVPDGKFDMSPTNPGGKHIEINAANSGTHWSYIQFYRPLPKVQKGQYIDAKIRIKASTNTTVALKLMNNAPPYTEYGSINLPLTTAWQEFSISAIAPEEVIPRVNLCLGNAGNGVTYYVDYAYGEMQKVYTTTFHDSTRQSENFTIPTTGVLNASEGTFETVFIPQKTPSKWARIFQWGGGWSSPIAYDDMRLLWNSGNGLDKVDVVVANAATGTGAATTVNLPQQLEMGKPYYIALRWKFPGFIRLTVYDYTNGMAYNNFANTTIVPTFTGYKNAAVGRELGGSIANGAIDDVRISNIARTDSDISAAYNNNVALPFDSYTTYKMNFDNNVDAKSKNLTSGGLVKVESNLSLDDGMTWLGWESVNSGDSIPDISATTDLSNAKLKYRVTLASDASGIIPTLNDVTVKVTPKVSAGGKATIAAKVTDSQSAIEIKKWAVGNQTAAYFATQGNAFYTDSFEVNANGTYTVYAKDASTAHNEAVQTITISGIDTIAPQIIDIDYTPKTQTPDKVEITFKAIDGPDGSGVNELKWLKGNKVVTDFVNAGTKIDDSRFTVTDSDTYTIFAKDFAGNAAVKTVTISNIIPDNTAPQITLTNITPAGTTGKAIIKADITDTGSGVQLRKWAKGYILDSPSSPISATNPAKPLPVTEFRSKGTLISDNPSTFNVYESGYYTVYAIDKKGNESVAISANITVLPDTTPPAIELGYTPKEISNQVSVKVNAYDDESTVTLIKWISGDKTLSDVRDNGTLLADNSFDVFANGTFTVYAKNTAGLETIRKITINNIGVSSDTTAPTIVLTPGVINTYADTTESDFKGGTYAPDTEVMPDGSVRVIATKIKGIYTSKVMDITTIGTMLRNNVKWNAVNVTKDLKFDGVDDTVTLDSGYSSVKDNFTYEFWVKPETTILNTATSIDGQKYVVFPVNRGVSGEATVGISVGTDRVLVFANHMGTLSTLLSYTGTIATPEKPWAHIAVVFTNRVPKLYIDGVAITSVSGIASANSIFPSSVFGAPPSGTSGFTSCAFKGSLDDVRVWKTSRTSTEIGANRNIELTGREQGLVSYWKFNEGTGTYAYDETVNTKTGTISGALWDDRNIRVEVRYGTASTISSAAWQTVSNGGSISGLTAASNRLQYKVTIDELDADVNTKANWALKTKLQDITFRIESQPSGVSERVITVEVADDKSGVAQVKWAQGSYTAATFPVATAEDVVDGIIRVNSNLVYSVYAKDNAGNSAVNSTSISGISVQGRDFIINKIMSGATVSEETQTVDSNVRLYFNRSSVTKIKVSNYSSLDRFTDASKYKIYNYPKTGMIDNWTLDTSTQGGKTVYVQFLNASGGIIAESNDSIDYQGQIQYINSAVNVITSAASSYADGDTITGRIEFEITNTVTLDKIRKLDVKLSLNDKNEDGIDLDMGSGVTGTSARLLKYNGASWVEKKVIHLSDSGDFEKKGLSRFRLTIAKDNSGAAPMFPGPNGGVGKYAIEYTAKVKARKSYYKPNEQYSKITNSGLFTIYLEEIGGVVQDYPRITGYDAPGFDFSQPITIKRY